MLGGRCVLQWLALASSKDCGKSRSGTAFNNTEHIEFEWWGPPLVDMAGTPSAKKSTKESKGKSGKSCICHYREMSKATGTKKPSESQKAKALWAMKAAWDRSEEFYDPARKDNILRRKQTRLELWEEHIKDPIAAVDEALKCLENPHWSRPLVRSFSWQVVWVAKACSCVGVKILQKMLEGV